MLTLALAACATSSGDRATAFLKPEIARAYVALDGHELLVVSAHGAGFAIAPGIAVTNAHNSGLVDSKLRIGESRDYDLLFFRTEKAVSLMSAAPRVGELVIAYGQGADGELREARGIVRGLEAPVEARCSS
ncbi:MAG: hypothetical protein JO348_06495, partial [Alphaproteobacteria bacterium]|nr:hypothetical protein [Alphaproteobacteria bacterium]